MMAVTSSLTNRESITAIFYKDEVQNYTKQLLAAPDIAATLKTLFTLIDNVSTMDANFRTVADFCGGSGPRCLESRFQPAISRPGPYESTEPEDARDPPGERELPGEGDRCSALHQREPGKAGGTGGEDEGGRGRGIEKRTERT